MGVEEEASSFLDASAQPGIKRTGTAWTAVAHIITGVIGSGVLSLAWSMAQLGWIAGPVTMFGFALVTLLSAFLLCDCYRYPDPEFGPKRNRSYLEAVHETLGKRNALICSLFSQIGLYGTGIAYTITAAISMRYICLIANGFVKGGIAGVSAYRAADKVWNVSQALGDIAFAYPYSLILLEIQIYSQPVFAVTESWIARKYPDNRFLNKSLTHKFPLLPEKYPGMDN
ncbi:AMINO ACID TRANSPORTER TRANSMEMBRANE DOMAIN-CONTAINING PROTEIN-RELATED [Salix viminalis]|uniref:AMINO ACID TRANSPORTER TRANSMEMBRANE DOMAIN-CONTAINING PROTEIN-RELATED n=1 Tax=Salix viminalis TaxID=40686 RepID=A0A9Q0U5Y4_SALVM|nr:AMINO ACID TRANSPORTER TRANSMEMBRANE DOMAIN-CONTAINING PROTEIN-RELATED [Salix viminalis]